MKLVVATRNRGKIREIKSILHDLGLQILSCLDFPELPQVVEDGESFRENAIKKAETVCKYALLPSLADDSGLEVDALGGRPGVLSSRFAGPECSDEKNMAKLLKLMRDVPQSRRQARFRCVVALALPGEAPQTVEGRCDGIISSEPRGRTGFGYDPIFVVPEYGKTFAELGEGVKNRISHRARALFSAKKLLVEILKT
ncbi:MAG: XTP/dITP diphosphatase [bacterium]